MPRISATLCPASKPSKIVQLGELLEYPTLRVDIDRDRAAQLGVSVTDVGRALAPATWSSRFTTPIYWADPNSGIAYQVQVQLPQASMSSIDDVAAIPVHQNGNVPTLLRDVASVRIDETYGEYHRRNMQRMVTVTANVHQTDLGAAAAVVAEKLGELPDPPRGVTVSVRGQLAPLSQIFENFRLGVVLSMIAVFLLLVAYFQSVRVALAVVTTLPGVLTGVFAALWVTGSTLNLQSFMGTMIAVGISVANAILLCTFAERYREEGMTSLDAALESGRSRLRPIVMTTLAFVEQMTAYLRVTAPFDGVVTERRVHVGALVGPDTSYLVRLEQVGRLRLVTPVPESYTAGVVRGAEVSFSVAAHVGESFTAVISRPSLSVSFDTRTMAVEADVDNRDGRLAPGMYAEVSWTLRRDKESLFVPRSAVARTTERVFVIRVRNGEAEWIDVRRGVFQRDRVEVFGNLTAGDRVVLHATDEIRPGTAVRVCVIEVG